MKWANFLHIYQPANQVEEILNRVVSESYKPLVQTLKDNPRTKITLNINAVLSEQLLEFGHKNLIDDIIFVAQRGQIEFTGSAKYHALLPFLEKDEIIRQIKLNQETNQKIFGSVYNPKGFFPPEMAYDPSLAPTLKELGFEWIIIDEIALNGRVNQVDTNSIYTITDVGLSVFFRERNPSNLIMSALVKKEEDFKKILGQDYQGKGYMVTGMDGETFGHHRPGLHKLLAELLISDEFEHVFFSELIRQIPERKSVSPVISTWASTEKDIEKGEQFTTWKESGNKIHDMQWELQHLVIHAFKNCQVSIPEEVNSARHKLDEALASDHFYWASAKPWWSLELIEAGAWALLDTLRSIPDCDPLGLQKAERIYHAIIAMAFEWQRTGYIRKIYNEYRDYPRIPFKDKTTDKGEPWVYEAFVQLMREAMKKATEKENFEESILWRDAIWKLDTKNDIYDAMHAVDLLRKQVTNDEVLKMIERYRREYERLTPGQPEPRG